MTKPRRIDLPEPGYWAIKLAKGGADVGARIFYSACPDCGAALDPTTIANVIERRPELAAEIDGDPADVDRVWLSRGRRIEEAEYLFLLADAQWCREHAPDEPRARPREKVDIRALRPLF